VACSPAEVTTSLADNAACCWSVTRPQPPLRYRAVRRFRQWVRQEDACSMSVVVDQEPGFTLLGGVGENHAEAVSAVGSEA